MNHDMTATQGQCWPIPTSEQVLTCVSQSAQALIPAHKRPGRPATLTNWHLCLGVLICGLRGFGSQLAFWRLLCLEPIGPFAPVQVVDQAVYNR